MSKRVKVVLAIVLGVIAAVAGLAWYLGLFSSEPEEASIDEATEILATELDNTDSDNTGDDDATPVAETVTDITGQWSVEASEATYVGYRIQEVLSSVGDFTAVGRTALVEGELTASGLTIESVSITADLTALRSDSGGRDGQLKTQALETNTFPQATFVLNTPIEIGAIPAAGSNLTTTASGELTIHGVTNTVEVNIEAEVSAGRLIVIGNMDILMSDYGITPPSARVVASIEDQGVMEFSLIFARN